MDDRVLAAVNVPYLAGVLAGALIIPAVGVALLIFGLRQRKANGSAGTVWVVMGAVVLIVGLIGAVAVTASSHSGRESAAAPKESVLLTGQCITDTDFLKQARGATAVDCAAPDAVFELAFTGPADATCPDGQTDHTVYYGFSNVSGIACFIPNLREGSCYRIGDVSAGISPRECSDPEAQLRVVRRVDGASDAGLCTAGGAPLSFPSPARTYCFERIR